jgi:hypothetical protein
VGEGSGREEESCLIHIEIIRPPSSQELEGSLFGEGRYGADQITLPFLSNINR